MSETTPGGAGNHLHDALLGGRAGDERAFLRAPNGEAWSYERTLAHARRIAQALIARGVRPGERVLAQVEKSPDALCVYLASIYAGAVYVPINPAYTDPELAFFVTDAEPAVVVAAPERREGADEAAAKVGAQVMTLAPGGRGDLLAAASAASDRCAAPPRGPDDLAAILYTSGTTGRSKGAMLTHDNLVSNARTLADAWRFTGEDVLLHALPIFHTHGLFVATNVVLSVGAAMIVLPKFDADTVFAQLPAATTMMGVPTFYTRLCADPRLTAKAAGHMRLFVSGSAPLLADTFADFERRTGHAILERY
ncbi:MAG: AMP-binding protein, partial [Caulobacterales bacterium]|nr:AMP-binding protein [Caulobacterales bacterium]